MSLTLMVAAMAAGDATAAQQILASRRTRHIRPNDHRSRSQTHVGQGQGRDRGCHPGTGAELGIGTRANHGGAESGNTGLLNQTAVASLAASLVKSSRHPFAVSAGAAADAITFARDLGDSSPGSSANANAAPHVDLSLSSAASRNAE